MKKAKLLLTASLVLTMLIVGVEAKAQNHNVILTNLPFEMINSKSDVMINIPMLEKNQEDNDETLQAWINMVNKQSMINITDFITSYTRRIEGANNLQIDIDDMSEFELYMLSNISAWRNSELAEISSYKYVMYSSWECFMNRYVVTLVQDNFIFTGGAHGIRNFTVDNYLVATGQKFEIVDYIADTTKFMNTVVKYFCKDRKIKTTAIKEQTGLFYELSELPMPKLIGLDSKGLRVIYEQYEIAPYAAGVIEVVVPFKELEDFLMSDFSKIMVKTGGEKYYFDTLE